MERDKIEAFEADRCRADEAAREEQRAEQALAAALGDEDQKPGAWKWAIRKRIWDHMEAENIAANPRPVHHRIPNFVNAELTALQVEQLPEFQAARWVKINPDSPQKPVRACVLRHGKMLLVPQPRLRTGFFSVLNPDKIPEGKYAYAVTPAGVQEFGVPIDLEAKIKVDMFVVGSVAVNPANGARIGKGEGFAELEYGMLRLMGAIDDDTPIVSCVHDCQLVDDIHSENMLCHDVPVDIICTPTQTIRVKSDLPKPQGIYWSVLSPQKLAKISILQKLKAKLERELGESLPSGPDEVLPPTAERHGKGGRSGGPKGRGRGGGRGGGGGGSSEGGKGGNRGGGRWGSRQAEAASAASWTGSSAEWASWDAGWSGWSEGGDGSSWAGTRSAAATASGRGGGGGRGGGRASASSSAAAARDWSGGGEGSGEAGQRSSRRWVRKS